MAILFRRILWTGKASMKPSLRIEIILGIAGVLPFAFLTVGLWILPGGNWLPLAKWLVAYSAVILTFQGALHWGVAMVHPEIPDPHRAILMGWSVVPALVAWVALAIPVSVGLVTIGLMFLVQLEADRRLVKRFSVTSWFLRLRIRLTIPVAILIMLAILSQS